MTKTIKLIIKIIHSKDLKILNIYLLYSMNITITNQIYKKEEKTNKTYFALQRFLDIKIYPKN
jgi:hypothetical protein